MRPGAVPIVQVEDGALADVEEEADVVAASDREKKGRLARDKDGELGY